MASVEGGLTSTISRLVPGGGGECTGGLVFDARGECGNRMLSGQCFSRSKCTTGR